MYVMYYASMLRCWQLVRILFMTNHPCLMVGHHSWYQSLMSIIPHWRPYFKNLWWWYARCPYKDYSSLNRWQDNRDLLTAFTFVMMHRRQGKKVSILSSGDVNTRPISSRWGLLEDSPYRAVGVVVHHATSHNRTPRACGDLGMPCGQLRKTWIRSCNICNVVHAALNAWASLRG
jgi:hypothetical protein